MSSVSTCRSKGLSAGGTSDSPCPRRSARTTR
ncbi:Uncharacterised protein [Bordetella pertussis]|nr:Uncharacterised protein [Bordetella pertussis]